MTSTLATRLPTPAADLQGYLKAVHAFPMLAPGEEHELAVRYRTGNDLSAAWRLVTSHLRFVVKIARGYRGYNLPEEDLIQEGNIGLMKAVKRFDPEVGVRLSSFALSWIKAEIHEYVLRNWRIVKVATTKAQRKLFFRLRGAKRRLGWLGADEVDRIAEDLEVRASDVMEMEQRLHAHDAPFDGTPGNDEDERPAPAALLEDRRSDPGEAVAEAQWWDIAGERMKGALAALDDRSRDIVTRRWLSEPKAKLRELAEDYSVSAERIRQIERDAFARLRTALEADRLVD